MNKCFNFTASVCSIEKYSEGDYSLNCKIMGNMILPFTKDC